jgi:hypothetical protein
MGKLKEKLLNNLTPEEIDYIYGPSAFEYVEYMENYKQQSEQIPEDVANQIGEEQKRLEQEFYEQDEINQLNESNKLKYTDNDILYVLERYVVDPQKIDVIMAELNDGWNIKNGFFE